MQPLALLTVAALLLFARTDRTIAGQSRYTDLDSPPGMYIWRGNQKTHIHCTGKGDPTVILESGLGGHSLDWVLVQPRIARFTRVCSYDRAGYGWSHLGSLPRSARRISQELDQLLMLAGERPPYLLTGHSYGGLIQEYFARDHGEKVAGMVLVDSANIQQFERMENGSGTTSLTPTSTNFVLFNSTSIPETIPQKYKKLAKELALQRRTILTLYSELRHFRSAVKTLQKYQRPAAIPTVVVSRGLPDRPFADKRKFSRELVWQQLQREMSEEKHAPLLISETADHHVHLSDPELVVQAVKSLLTTIRKSPE